MSLNVKLWGWLGVKEQGDFTTDLNLCFKWLVPKLVKSVFRLDNISFQERGGKECVHIEFQPSCNDPYGWETVTGEASTPALALCLAIEKLIDK